MTAVVIFDWIRSGLGALSILVGVLLMLGAIIGLLRFPDVFTRLHAAGAAMSVGVCVALFGVLLLAGSVLIAAKLAFLIVLVAVMTPVLSHIVASAAHAAGIAPIVGPYTAPRPGVRGQ